MTRRSFKIAILGLVGFTILSGLSYIVFSTIINTLCYALLYMFKQPVNSIIIILSIMSLTWIAGMLYTLYKKN